MDIIYESSELFVYVGLITSLFFAVYLFFALIEIYTGKFTLNYIKEISVNISVLIPNSGTEIIIGSFF